jgi:hypothetical protein
MAKTIVNNYRVDLAENAVYLQGNIHAKNLLIMTDTDTNTIIYNFASPALGYQSVTYNNNLEYTQVILTTNLTTAGVTTTANIQIFVEQDNVDIDFNESLLDPVNKIRVSMPENLIDTDFEYGLQSTKWETLELSNNIPSFYSNASDGGLSSITRIECLAASDIITVTCFEPHRLVPGTPIDVRGLTSVTAEGKYLIATASSDYIFTFKARAVQSITGIISGPYTTITPGQFYSGSQIGFTTMTTDGQSPSTVTVNTANEHGFRVGANFYLINSVSPKFIEVTQTAPTAPDGRPYVDYQNTLTSTFTNNASLTETKRYRGGYYKKINASNVDTTADTITWTGHLLRDGDCLLYIPPAGDTAIGGLQRFQIYFVVNASGNTFKLSDTYAGAPINLTSTGTYTYGQGGFHLCYGVSRIYNPDWNTYFYSHYWNYGTGSGWDRYQSAYYNNNFGYMGLAGATSVRPRIFMMIFKNGISVQSNVLSNYYSTAKNPNMVMPEVSSTPGPYNFIEDAERYYFNYGFDSNQGQLNYYDQSAFYGYGFNSWSSYNVQANLYYNRGDAFVMPLFEDEEADSFYSVGSNVLDGTPISFTLSSGSLPQQTTYQRGNLYYEPSPTTISAGTYTVEKLSADRFRIKNGATPLFLYSANGTYAWTAQQTNVLANTFYSTNHGLTTDDTVKIQTLSGGVLPTTSTGNIMFDASVNMPVLWTFLKSSVEAYKASSGISFVDLTMDGFSRSNPFQYAGTGTTWSDSAIENFNYQYWSSNNTTGQNGSIDFNYAYDTELPENLGYNSGIANDGFKIVSTKYIQNRTIPYFLQVVAPPKGIFADIQTYRSMSNGLSTAQLSGNYSRTNFSGQWYYQGIWGMLGGASSSPSRKGFIWFDVRIWNEDWSPAQDNFNFTSWSGSTGGQVYGSGYDYFNAFVALTTASTVTLDSSIVDGLRDKIMTDFATGFVYPSLTNGITAKTTVVNNNRFKIKTATTGFEFDLQSSGSPTLQFELVNLSFGSADGAYAVSAVPTPTTLQFLLPFKAAAKTFSFNSATAIDAATDLITLANHYIAPATPLIYASNGNTPISGLTSGTTYYAYVRDPDTIGVAASVNDALGGNLVGISTATGSHLFTSSTVNGLVPAKGTVAVTTGSRVITGSNDTLFKRYFKIGDTVGIANNSASPGPNGYFTVSAIADDNRMLVTNPVGFTSSSTAYLIGTFLYVRPDGTFQHRPFDGGVEITAGTAPDSQIVRQTRKYFRYQSGKGIQISLAINFNPPRLFQSLTGVSDTTKITKCQRDIGYILDGVEYDITLGTNYNARFYGIAETNSLDISPLVISAINASKTQVLALSAVSSDATSTTRVNDYYTELLNIVENDRTYASELTFTNPSGATASQIAVKDKLLANLLFLEDEVNAYVNVTYPAHDHDVAKCSRDVKYAVHGICYDLLYGGNTATYNGAKFFMYAAAAGTSGIASVHKDQTVAAYARLKTVISQVVQGQAVTVSAGNTTAQVTSGNNASSGDAAIAQGLVQVISDVINTSSIAGLPAKVYPSTTWASAGLQASKAAIIAAASTISTTAVPNIVTATGTTKYPHGLTVGARFRVQDSSDNSYNGTFPVTTVPDAFTFTYTLQTAPSTTIPAGLPTYNIESWSNSAVRCGLYDFQNGFFFEFDGATLKCCRRSSTTQISGEVSVRFNSNVVTGTNTNFIGQLEEGEKIVIRGMTYKITKITSRTSLVIQPQYKGANGDGVIVTKTIDTKIPQSQWSLDVCDGSGFTGYVLDITKIQMSYCDYSWYGAGKIRFGFKTVTGRVQYVHEFVHNNRLTEAYMRSGNLPARYEIENTGTATYIPSLFHWGTSVIMDGRFDDDKAYLFTANSNTLNFTNGQSIQANTQTNSSLKSEYNRTTRTYDWFVELTFSYNDYTKFQTGTQLYTADLQLNGNQVNSAYYGQFYVVRIFITSSFFAPVAGSYPVVASGTTVGIGAPVSGGADGSAILRSVIPLISIRLAPSVDNSLTGNLGEREIINRMQLQLREVGLVLTHDAEVSLVLNSNLSTDNFVKVQSPSLSNLIKHNVGDVIVGGTTIFQFRASGGSVSQLYNQQSGQYTNKRISNTSNFDLSQISDLGNCILGGNGVFPNGPDLLTVGIKVIDVAEVSANSPFSGSARITWAESQA